MSVVAAAIEALRLPLRRPLVTSQGTVACREGFLLRLTDGAGAVGVGEASPAYWIGEGSLGRTSDDLRRVVAWVRERPSARALRARLDEPGALVAAAACALDGALLDLEARARGVAVATLLGGAGAATVAVAALVAGDTLDALASDVDAALGRGFTTLKLKVGAEPLAADLRRIAAVRARAGSAIRLRLDANRAWTPGEAARALAAFLPFAIEYVEEPLRPGDPAELAALARMAPLPLAVDESIVDAADLQRLVAAGAPVHVVLKAARVGGPTRLLALARYAQLAALPVVVTDSLESVIGMSLALHMAAALPEPRAAVGLGGAQLVAADGPAGSHRLRVPRLVPGGPGLTVAAPDPGDTDGTRA